MLLFWLRLIPLNVVAYIRLAAGIDPQEILQVHCDLCYCSSSSVIVR